MARHDDTLVRDVSFAIWRAWARETDDAKALQRFERLKPAVREQFDNEARAAIDAVHAARAEA